jgi:hypothetical protein
MCECSICLEEIDEEDIYQLEECKHTFHVECIREWEKHKNTCPLCRTKFKIPVLSDPCLDAIPSAPNVYAIGSAPNVDAFLSARNVYENSSAPSLDAIPSAPNVYAIGSAPNVDAFLSARNVYENSSAPSSVFIRGPNYNILRIVSGMGGAVFSN